MKDKFDQLNYINEKLKEFILNDKQFYECAKKYTFMYREFSPLKDCYEIYWNKKKKEWESAGEAYCCRNQNEDVPQKKNVFLLDLTIDGYNWGTLFNRMETMFTENLKVDMTDEDINDFIENEYEKYVELREIFFNTNKQKIVDDWFDLKEQEMPSYFENQIKKLREVFLIKKQILF